MKTCKEYYFLESPWCMVMDLNPGNVVKKKSDTSSSILCPECPSKELKMLFVVWGGHLDTSSNVEISQIKKPSLCEKNSMRTLWAISIMNVLTDRDSKSLLWRNRTLCLSPEDQNHNELHCHVPSTESLLFFICST